ncbi:predicted protein [Botrytis cinerea T4]|uniref:Thioesterase domain-containing protein n=1 Tax=Botryotinia fuckeliana (strain T4) TaxID=999810 RepID=G2XTM4_BOTF4|nr:predicted protein [Botrytis cinerea T4]
MPALQVSFIRPVIHPSSSSLINFSMVNLWSKLDRSRDKTNGKIIVRGQILIAIARTNMDSAPSEFPIPLL